MTLSNTRSAQIGALVASLVDLGCQSGGDVSPSADGLMAKQSSSSVAASTSDGEMRELGFADAQVTTSREALHRVDAREVTPLLDGTTPHTMFPVDRHAIDQDHDGVLDSLDNCPITPNPDQLDSLSNDIGDACRCLGIACPRRHSCHAAGHCEPATGTCTEPNLPDGTRCRLAHADAACAGGLCQLVACHADYADCNGDPSDGCETSIATTSNCGGCGQICPEPHDGRAVCRGGQCELLCVHGTGNCDGDVTTGCETDLRNNPFNCGRCGNVCNDQEGCLHGGCSSRVCQSGWANCVRNHDGCETNIAADPSNCGGCLQVCAALPNAVVACSGAACVIESCNVGYFDCNGVIDDGCETNIYEDQSNCGDCGALCAPPNAVGVCEAGSCHIVNCLAGYSDCDGSADNGCESALFTDTRNCGSCGHVCKVANGSATCSDGSCGIASCVAPYANCDGLLADGCEAQLSTSTSNCGTCGTVCSVANNAISRCFQGVCGLAYCQGGYADCNGNLTDGCETHVATDLANCGGCAVSCTPSANTSLICNQGHCFNDCLPGFADCDGNLSNGCEMALGSSCEVSDSVCQVPHGLGQCLSGGWTLLRCTPGFSDCNDEPSDGCEVYVGPSGCLAESIYSLTVKDEACTAFCERPGSPPTYSCQQGPPLMNVTVTRQNNESWLANLIWPLGFSAWFPRLTPTPFSLPLVETVNGFAAKTPSEGDPGFGCASTGFGGGSLTFSIDCTGLGTASVNAYRSWDRPNGCSGDCSVKISGSGSISSGGGTKGGCQPPPEDNDVLPALGSSPIASGYNHTCFTTTGGAIRCWGDNSRGQLGVPGNAVSARPLEIPGLVNVQTVSTGGYAHTCALIADSTVRCWGDNYQGALGDGTTTNSGTPVGVLGLTAARAISTGGGFTCAVLQDGGARCWGYNNRGRLGNGSTVDSTTPTTVLRVFQAIAITTGDAHACALMEEGSVMCWGADDYGQLGNGVATAEPNPAPTPVLGISTAIAISAGQRHTCALLHDNSIRCWGDGTQQQLGDGKYARDPGVPVSVLRISRAVAVSAGGYHTCALLDGGIVQCWGDNGAGQLGNGTTIEGYVPGTTALPGPAVALSSGFLHTCVLLQDGTARCWGSNHLGQLGIGTTSTIVLEPTTVLRIP